MKWLIWPVVFVISLGGYAQQSNSAVPKWHYVLINDGSGRTMWPGGTEEQAKIAEQFLKDVVQRQSDMGSLVNVSDEAAIDVQNSTDPDQLASQLVRHGRGGTAIYDGIVAAAQWLDKQDSTGKQKIIFVFSDFDDDASHKNLQEAISAMQQIRIPTIFVAPSDIEHKGQGKKIRHFVQATDGHAYFVPKNGSFDFSSLRRDLGR